MPWSVIKWAVRKVYVVGDRMRRQLPEHNLNALAQDSSRLEAPLTENDVGWRAVEGQLHQQGGAVKPETMYLESTTS